MTEVIWFRSSDRFIIKMDTFDHVQMETAKDSINQFRQGSKILILPKGVTLKIVDDNDNGKCVKPIASWVSFLERHKGILEIKPITAEPGKFMFYGHGESKVDENDLLILANDCRRLVDESASKRTNSK